MCWIGSLFARKRKAEEDIVVYKMIHIYEGKWYTPFYGKLVVPGNTYHSRLNVERSIYNWKTFIEEGLHSCIEGELWITDKRAVIQCIIPKGAYYYKNESEYVSTSLRYPTKLKKTIFI